MSFYAGLSASGNSLISFLLRGAKEGKSGAAVMRAIQDVDKGYRRKIFDKDYAIVSSYNKQFKGMRNIGKSKTIPEHWYAPAGSPLSATGKIARPQYQTIIELRGIHKITGEAVTGYVTVSHNTTKLRKELEADALYAANETSPKVKWTKMLPVLARRTAVLWT